MSAEALLAAVVLLACVVALARLVLGDRRRARFDAALQRHAAALARRARGLRQRRQVRDQAEREAAALIRRAQAGRPAVDRDGNVYRPRQFGTHGSRREGDSGDAAGPERDAPDGRHRRDH